MKNFIYGAFGALTVLILSAIAIPQYSNYIGQSEVSRWLGEVVPTQTEIEQKIISLNTTFGSGIGITLPASLKNITVSKVSEEGIIFLKGGKAGQFIVLVPSLKNGKVNWQCFGGPNKSVPIKCKTA